MLHRPQEVSRHWRLVYGMLFALPLGSVRGVSVYIKEANKSRNAGSACVPGSGSHCRHFMTTQISAQPQDMVEGRLQGSSTKTDFRMFSTPDFLLQLTPLPRLTPLRNKLRIIVEVLEGCERSQHTTVIRMMVCPSLSSVL